MLKIGQATLGQRLQNVNISLCLTDHTLVTVQLQNDSFLQEHGGSNQWRIYKQFPIFLERG